MSRGVQKSKKARLDDCLMFLNTPNRLYMIIRLLEIIHRIGYTINLMSFGNSAQNEHVFFYVFKVICPKKDSAKLQELCYNKSIAELLIGLKYDGILEYSK